MSEPTEQRGLAAIMFTDLVGYSALAQRDERLALDLLAESQRLLRAQFPPFHGREVKNTGDGFLVEFPSALEAAQCAVEIQRALVARNATESAARRMRVRIGLHVGDVVHRGADIFGDGVNIAARIEPLAAGGGICLTETVAAQVRNKLGLELVPLGSPAMKNIAMPLAVYRVVLPWENAARARRRPRALVPALAALLLVLTAAALWWFTHRADRPVTPAPAASVAGKSAPAEKSVAVLAFDDLSEKRDNEYFSDGISEELLTVLQKIPGLRVAARTSAFSVKGKNATAQEIGLKLGVAHLVEGSVQKSGSRVKITARLSRVATGEELWSRSYTRELKDVFALQEELATAIVGELREQLGTAGAAAAVRVAARGGTVSPEAHQEYLQGRYRLNRFALEDIDAAIGHFQRATELDPKYALAWAALSRSHAMRAGWTDKLTRQQSLELQAQARRTADRALELDPDLPEALSARFELQFIFDFDWKGGAATIRKALVQAPSDPVLLTSASRMEGLFGHYDRAVELLRQAVELDPINSEIRSYLGLALLSARRFPEARTAFARAIELNPGVLWAHFGTGLSYLYEGKFAEGITACNRDQLEGTRLLGVAIGAWKLGRKTEADAALARLVADYATSAAFQVAEAYGIRGDKDRAFEWLERARVQQDSGFTFFPNDPFFDALRSDPRWAAFQRRMGLAEDQLK